MVIDLIANKGLRNVDWQFFNFSESSKGLKEILACEKLKCKQGNKVRYQ